MKLTCDRRDLAQGLDCVVRAVNTRSSLAVMANVLLEATGATLRLAATDLELRIVRTVPVSQVTAGAMTLPGRLFFEIVQALPQKEITLAAGDGETTTEAVLTSGKSRYQMPTLSPGEFPALPEVGRDGQFSMAQAELVKMIDQTLFAASNDDTRPILTGVLFELSEGALILVATDTHRLAIRAQKIASITTEAKLLVPARSLSELRAVLDAGGREPVRVQWDENQIQFQTEATTLISRLLSGGYPAYQRIMPAEFSRSVTVDREELIQTVRRAEIVSKDDGNRVILRTAGDKLFVTAKSPTLGRAEEQIDATCGGDAIEFALNGRYLRDGLGAIETGSALIEMNEPLAAVVLSPVGAEGQKVLISPMRPE